MLGRLAGTMARDSTAQQLSGDTDCIDSVKLYNDNDQTKLGIKDTQQVNRIIKKRIL